MKADTLKFALDADGKTAVFRVAGRPSLADSNALRKAIDELLKEGRTHFAFDLSECTRMDSTFLGVLTGLALMAERGEAPVKVELCRATDELRGLFDTLGVAGRFCFLDGWNWEKADFKPLVDEDEGDKLQVHQTSLQAHRNLMDANDANIPKFKMVVDLMAKELMQKTAGRGK